jgi:flagellar L-ring protein precursor FlgH
MRKPMIATAGLAALLATACTTHIAPYRPKHRRFDPGEYGDAPSPAGASLYAGDQGFFEDDVAGRVGDILVILIDESEAGSSDGATKLKKTAKSSYGVPSSFGLLPALAERYPGLDPGALFGVDNDSDFQGTGAVTKSGRLSATVPVRVRRVLPNGDLYVEGTKVILVGSEEHHLYISGVVRRADIRANNTVPSSRVADAEIEYTGRGDVSDQQRQGWLSRMLGKVWPF